MLVLTLLVLSFFFGFNFQELEKMWPFGALHLSTRYISREQAATTCNIPVRFVRFNYIYIIHVNGLDFAANLNARLQSNYWILFFERIKRFLYEREEEWMFYLCCNVMLKLAGHMRWNKTSLFSAVAFDSVKRFTHFTRARITTTDALSLSLKCIRKYGNRSLIENLYFLYVNREYICYLHGQDSTKMFN